MFETIGHLPIGWLLLAFLAAIGFLAFYAGKRRIVLISEDGLANIEDHSRPNYHGYFVALMTCLPVALIAGIYVAFGDTLVRQIIRSELPDYVLSQSPVEIELFLDQIARTAASQIPILTGNNLFDASAKRYAELLGMVRVVTISIATLVGFFSFRFARGFIKPDFQARSFVERAIGAALFASAALAVFVTVAIIASLALETFHFFSVDDAPSIWNFLLGTEWNAQTGTSFGALPLFLGTIMIAILAMLVAAPIGLFSAIYLSEYASPLFRETVKPILEILAGVPTVVYGFFAATLVAPIVRSCANWINSLDFTPENLLAAQPTSALAAGLVMGVMIIPFVSSLSADVIRAVPQPLRDGALAVGATKSEMIKHVILPAAYPGIIAALLLAVSRAIGETMIVVMAAGGRSIITADPTSDVTTVTYQIVSLLTGDTAFDSAKTLSAFALGAALFASTLLFNMIALRVARKYRVKYA